RGHDRYGEFEVTVVDTNHPVTKGVPQTFKLKDELYYFKVDSTGPGIDILTEARSEQSGPSPSVVLIKHPNANVVGMAWGHDGDAHDLDADQALQRHAPQWLAK